MEPTEDLILQVCEFTSLDPGSDRNLVAAALREKHCNVEAVVTEFYNDEAKFRSRHRWDEGMFAVPRDGPIDTIPSFNIDAPSVEHIIHGVSPSHVEQLPPSRPPSRTHSPLGRPADSNDQVSGGMPSIREQEDVELQRALAESAATGLANGDATLPYFGPANRSEYDQAQWAMVPLNSESPEPGASGRKRVEGVPAFLRCRQVGDSRHRLGGLLTVFHEIPVARNALLSSGAPADTYGHDSDWYKGTRIELPGQLSQPDNPWLDVRPEFSQELHRLMAFLDLTDRSYGTADVLIDIRRAQAWGNDFDRDFFDALKQANIDENGGLKEEIVPLFTGVEDLTVPEDQREMEAAALFDVRIPEWQLGQPLSLYNLMDQMIWGSMVPSDEERMGQSRRAALSVPGAVVTMRFTLEEQTSFASFEIPELWYADRYLKDNNDRVSELRRQIGQVYETLNKAAIAKERITKWCQPSTGKWVDRCQLSEACIRMHQGKITRMRADALWRRHEELKDTDQAFEYRPGVVDHLIELTDEEERFAAHHEACATIHERKIAGINKKLKVLEREQKACEELLHELSSRYTVPSNELDWHPTQVYYLQGVVINPDTVYVHQHVEPDLIELEDTTAPEDKWWLLGYLPSEENPVKAEVTTFEAVQRHFTSCSREDTPICVYADARALAAQRLPLTEAQRTFVRFDNRLFKQELLEEVPSSATAAREARKRASIGTPASPPKRLQRSGSDDSMATNRASVGGDLSDRDELETAAAAGGADDLIFSDFVHHNSNDDDDGSAMLLDTSVSGPASGGGSKYPAALEAPNGVRQNGGGVEPRATEMVELPIRHNSSSGDEKNTSNKPARNEVVGEANSNNNSRPAAAAAARSERAKTASFIADWDNPEGKLVETEW